MKAAVGGEETSSLAKAVEVLGFFLTCAFSTAAFVMNRAGLSRARLLSPVIRKVEACPEVGGSTGFSPLNAVDSDSKSEDTITTFRERGELFIGE